MIKLVKGNLLNAETEALVNTVNTVGVMGKGIALQFKKKFPQNYVVYRKACKDKTFNTGEVLTVEVGDLLRRQIIINFPTKAHWRSPSKYEYISEGLKALKAEIIKHKINSIAIPPLGCGNGGLEWTKVKSMIEESLQDLDCEIHLYTPNKEIKAVLQKEENKATAELSPARAMLLYLMFAYEASGEQSSLFAVNKLAWFLQRRGEKLRLKFEAHHYGPYSVQINHVLQYLNGVYLKGMEQNVVKPFEPLILNYDKYQDVKNYINTKLTAEHKQRLEDVTKLLRGFESDFSIELLASIDYILKDDKSKKVEDVAKELASWNKRKNNLYQAKHVETAYNHLKKYSNNIFELAD